MRMKCLSSPLARLTFRINGGNRLPLQNFLEDGGAGFIYDSSLSSSPVEILCLAGMQSEWSFEGQTLDPPGRDLPDGSRADVDAATGTLTISPAPLSVVSFVCNILNSTSSQTVTLFPGKLDTLLHERMTCFLSTQRPLYGGGVCGGGHMG